VRLVGYLKEIKSPLYLKWSESIKHKLVY